MAYNPLVFTVGQVLTATQMGLVQGNIDTVRISHRGTSPPTSPPGGAMWWDESQPIWNLNFNTGSGSWIPAMFLDTQSREAGMAAQGKSWGSVPMVNREQTRTVFAGMPYFPKNMLLNANFQYWQRGLTFNTIFCGSFMPDRWLFQLQGAGRMTVRQTSLVPTGVAGDYALELIVGSARTTMGPGDIMSISQPVEGSVLGRAAYGRPDARPTRVSFWLWSNVTGRLSLSLQGGSGSANYLAPCDIDVANSWLFKEFQIPAPTSGSWQQRDNRCQAYLGLTFAAHSLFLTSSPGAWQYANAPVNIASVSGQLNGMGGIGTTFRMTAVQWEIGEISTPIEMLPEAIELPMLRRYFTKSFPLDVRPADNALNTSSPVALWGTLRIMTNDEGITNDLVTFPAPMRTTPRVTFFNPINGAVGCWWNISDGRITGAGTSSGYTWREGFFPGVFPATPTDARDNLHIHWTADAEIVGWN